MNGSLKLGTRLVRPAPASVSSDLSGVSYSLVSFYCQNTSFFWLLLLRFSSLESVGALGLG